MNKLLYISTGLPREEANRVRQSQVDFSSNALLTHSVFHENLREGLAKSYDGVEALCGAPIDGKKFKIFRYHAKRIQKDNIRYVIPGFINRPGIKQLTDVVKIFFHTLRWYHQNKAHNCNIFIDGAYFSGMIALAAAKRFMKAKATVSLVDYYASFMDPEGQKPLQKLYQNTLRQMDRFVVVTEYMQKLMNRQNKPYMIMEGLVDVQQTEEAETPVGDYCLYAGGLHEMYGVPALVDAFHESEIPYSLHLYGNGDAIDYIRKISQEDPRIQYKGIVAHEELLRIERGAKLLVNPRPVRGQLDTRYNFPSKLMEYMQSGRPAITTRLLGIPQEYDGYMYFFRDDTKEALKEGLEKVCSLDAKTLSAFGSAARAYVNENKNNIAVGKKIFGLMNTGGGAGNEKMDQ